ncbi:MAG: hypothetical protein ABI297_03445 [Ginsengibacter sp.]
MKRFYKLVVLCLVIMTYFTTQGQIVTSNRQAYFNKYAEKLPTPESELEKAFTTPEGRKININFADFSFNGIVTSSVKRYDNLYSVIVKATGLNNTLFSVSKIINADKSISYVGRIINENYADGYQLRKDNGRYDMNKIRTDALIEDY